MEKHRNPDGTYNGVAVMSEMTGLSPAEIRWTFERIKHLIHAEGKDKEAAKAIVKAECVNKPWEPRQ